VLPQRSVPQPRAPRHNIICNSFYNEIMKLALRVFVKDEQAAFQALRGERVKKAVKYKIQAFTATCMCSDSMV